MEAEGNIMSKKRLDIPMLGVIFSLAWPTMLQELMQTAVQYIDTAMVGSLGTQATAAVGATGTVAWLVNGTVSALGVGFLAYISQAVGAGEPERAKRAAAQSALMALMVGTLCRRGLRDHLPESNLTYYADVCNIESNPVQRQWIARK